MHRRNFWIGCSAVAVVVGLASAGHASNMVLQDQDGLAQININPLSPTFRPGVNALIRNNVSGVPDRLADLVQQSYFARSQSMAKETEINSLATPSVIVTDTSPGDGQPNILSVRYVYQTVVGSDDFTVFVDYRLQGGASGSMANTLSRSVKIQNNNTTSPLSFSFFSYTDLTLTGIVNPPGAPPYVPGTPYNDNTSEGESEFAQIKTINGTTKAWQWDTHPVHGLITDSESVPLGPANHNGGRPDRVEANTSGSLLSALMTGPAYNLANANTLSDQTFSLVGGVAANPEYAFQYDFVLAPKGTAGDSFLISETTLIIPEPATLGLVIAGAGLLLWPRRARRVA